MFNGTRESAGRLFHLPAAGRRRPITTARPATTAPTISRRCRPGALERALFMESDRMGHLLGAVTQGVLDNQRGVVQNEKRQGDSRPGGLVQYALFENLFPAGHPYHHTVIGSMADLDAASLADVKQWFRDRYGPNNAVLVIAGDVTRRRRGRWSRNISARSRRGRSTIRRWPAVPTLATPKHDRDEGPASRRPSSALLGGARACSTSSSRALDIGGSVLGGLASSRLDQILVRDEKLAVAVSAGLIAAAARRHLQRSALMCKPGIDPALVVQAARRDRRRLYRQGPDRGRGPARGDERSLGPNPRARAGRRLRRQGGRAGRRADARRRQRFLQDDRSPNMRRSRRRRCARRCSNGCGGRR